MAEQQLWTSKRRNYRREKNDCALQSTPAYEHPLRLTTSKTTIEVKAPKKTLSGSTRTSRSSSISSEKSVRGTVSLDPLNSVLEGKDPLSVLAAEANDPLSAAAAEKQPLTRKSTEGQDAGLPDGFEPWSSRKADILSKYTTSEKLSITTSFLSPDDKDKVLKTQAVAAADVVKHRLEQLDDFEEGSVKEMLNLSQQEYVSRIDELNSALISAWNSDHRVKSLKIAIQCSKLLADVSVIQFYPSKFVLITEILDTFGKLVFDRIREKATYLPKGSSRPVQLPTNFRPEDVPDTAKETCRNWFFKIASIRELVPRFYVEAALLGCYSFLAEGEYNSALRRLASMTRGIGDPLVAMYARCYISRVGVQVAPNIRDHLFYCYEDFITTYKQMEMSVVQNTLASQRLELGQYLQLYSPALDWLMQCLAHLASDKIQVQVLEKAKLHCNNALLLNSIMSTYKAEFVSQRAAEFTEMIKSCDDAGFPKHLLYKSLGRCVVVCDPPESDQLSLLNDVWKAVTKVTNPANYIACAEVWVEFIAKHFTNRELNVFLGDVVKHMTPDRAFAEHYPQLTSIITRVLAHQHNFAQLLAMEKFLSFLDLFQKDSVKAEVCQTIVDSYCRWQTDVTNDPVIVNTIMSLCKTLHDSISALSGDDDVRAVSQCINGFVRSVSFGKDVEQQLAFYVEARGAFTNLDSVLVNLVQNVNTLIMYTLHIVHSNHTRKTAAFVRACLAYNFITIPSLRGTLIRLKLYLLTGQVAMVNNCLTQGDAFLKSAISLLPDLPRSIIIETKTYSIEPMILQFVANFLSVLLVVPDNPDQEVLYLLRGLLNVLQSYKWDSGQDTYPAALCQVLSLLSAMSQEVFAYHVPNIESNDSLYGNDPKFLNELNSLSETVMGEILQCLKKLDGQDMQRRQAHVAALLFHILIAHGDLSNNPTLKLCSNLCQMIANSQDSKLRRGVVTALEMKASKCQGPYTSLLTAISS